MSAIFFDPVGGAAGDMIVGALLDLRAPGLDIDWLRGALAPLGDLGGYRIELDRVTRHSVSCAKFRVLTGGAEAQHGHGHAHVHRPYGDIKRLVGGAPLDPVARDIALACFAALAEAEGAVHRIAPDDVEFHEVGAVDSLVDVVGAALCLARLGAPPCFAGPLPVSGGTIRTQHGVLPLPAPATAHLITGIPIIPAPGRAERVTPTAAAVLRTVVGEWGAYPPPSLSPARALRIGYGAGDRDDQDLPDYLRIVELDAAGTAPIQRPG